MSDEERLDDPLGPEPSPSESVLPILSISSLLQGPGDMGLTPAEHDELRAIQQSFIILGPAAGAVLICPGNQVGVPEDKLCPYAAKCPLLRAQKAPQGRLCPIERSLTEERFSSWCSTIDKDPGRLNEADRSTVAALVWIDIQEQRCVNIMSSGEASRLTQTNVTEAVPFSTTDPLTHELINDVLPLTWERVIHVNTQLLDQLVERRRMILKDWMITPEQKWKIDKAEGKRRGTDLGTQQSILGDKARKGDPIYY
jgi:hypothetical protein